jgi:hypothetical protein
MRLTNYMRDAFICAAMNDVPQVDYDPAIREAATKAALANLPMKVQAVWSDPETRQHLETTYCSFGHRFTINVPGACTKEHRAIAEAAALPLVEKSDAQRKSRDALQSKLRAVAYGVTTRKALVDALPEFEKYLPADEPAAIKTLPVLANVVTDFVKAGWPKGKKAA